MQIGGEDLSHFVELRSVQANNRLTTGAAQKNFRGAGLEQRGQGRKQSIRIGVEELHDTFAGALGADFLRDKGAHGPAIDHDRTLAGLEPIATLVTDNQTQRPATRAELHQTEVGRAAIGRHAALIKDSTVGRIGCSRQCGQRRYTFRRETRGQLLVTPFLHRPLLGRHRRNSLVHRGGRRAAGSENDRRRKTEAMAEAESHACNRSVALQFELQTKEEFIATTFVD